MDKDTKDKIKKLRTRIRIDQRVNDTQLSRELKEQAPKFSYWGEAHAIKLHEFQVQKKELGELEAEIGTLAEATLRDLKAKDAKLRITDKVIRDNVVTNDQYKEEHQKLLDLGLEESILSVAKEAFRQRAQLILEMARQERYELGTPETLYIKQLKELYKKEDKEDMEG